MLRLINRLLNALGWQIQPYPSTKTLSLAAPDKNVAGLVQELEGCFREYAFPHIPTNAKRALYLQHLLGTNVSEAMWLLQSLHQALELEGAVCEFGLAQGATSALLANEILATNKTLWLFDSFQGLSVPTEKDVLIDDMFNLGNMAAYAGTMSYPVKSVLGRLAEVGLPLERVEIVEGFIETTIKGDKLPDKVCFAYVDFDLYEPILVGLQFLATKLSINGYIVVDDYNFFSAGAQAAVDEFVAAQNGAFELTLPPEWAGHFAVLKRLR